jgi:two-component system, sensor histidine kinase and response regulator
VALANTPRRAERQLIELDPQIVAREETRREQQLHTRVVPQMRLASVAILLGIVAIHGAFVAEFQSWWPFVVTACALVGYSLLSWWAVATWFGRTGRINLGDVFLTLDVPMWIAVVYLSGAEASWLFVILLARLADPVNTTRARVLFFTAVTALAYMAMDAYIVFVDHRALIWPTEVAKVVFLVGFGVYVSARARTAESIRNSTSEAVEFAKQLIDELDQHTQALERAHADAEAASKAKQEFLANMSRELRTPMNGVVGIADLMQETPLDDEQRELLDIVSGSAQSLLRVINDILDFSKIDSGMPEIEPIPFDLHRTLTDSVGLQAHGARQKSLALRLSIGTDVPQWVLGDPRRVRQVATNLIANAIKFTREGEVAIRVEREVDPSQVIRFEVDDTGVGVASEKQAEVFGHFAQTDSFSKPAYGGTGLGLATSAHLVELMGGEMGVTSEPGVGAKFWFTVPLPISAPPLVKRAPESALRRVAVDNGTGIDWASVSSLLAARDVKVVPLDELGSERPDVVVVITQRTGPDAQARIHKARSNMSEAVPVLLVCNEGQQGDRAFAAALKLAGYLSMPIGDQDLADAILEVTEATEPHQRVVTRPAPTQARANPVGDGCVDISPCVLLVEDNRINQLVALKILRKLGYRVEQAENGQVALDLAADNEYAAILMDCEMPVMDGFEATRLLRERGGDKHIPIIAMTANAMQGDRERCLTAGMDDYISKPFEAQALQHKLAEWIASA